jgi:zinc protease
MRPLALTRTLTFATTLAASLAPAATALAQYPTTPPTPTPIKAAAFPPFQEATLPNGLRLVVVQSKKQPVVAVSLAFPAGSFYDPAGRSGTADMVAGMLTKGAGKRSADQIADAIEGVGGALSAGADADFLSVRTAVLTNDTKLAFELLADVVIRPTFPEKELELLRTQTLSGLQLEQSQPASIADRFFLKGLYGEHPYARKADPASVKAITRDDLVKFHKARLCPSGALLVVSGDLSLADAKKLAAAAFAGWTGTAATVAATKEPPTRKTTEILLVHRAGSVQSNILVGNTTWEPTNPRSYAATVMNKVLGDGASGRLFMTLREAKSWTYGAYSAFERRKGLGYFVANTEVRTEVTDSALVELMAQLKRVTVEPIPDAEIDAAKNSIAGAFPLKIESSAQVAAQVASVKLYDLSKNYLQTYRQRIASVTSVAAQTAAFGGVHPDKAIIVVVGDGAKIYDKLKKVAPVRIVGTDGAALKPEDLAVKAGALDIARDRILATSDSFAVMVQGNALGYQKSSLVKAEGGWLYTEDSQIAGVISQHTEVRFTEALEMRSVAQNGKQAGKETKINVTYAGGRAKGSASTPQPPAGEIKTVAVDAEVPAGAVDDNIITALFPGLKFAAGAKIPVTVFQSGKGAAVTLTMTVAGEEEVKVPAGSFTVWKVEMSGGEQPGTFYVEKAAPHRLIKLGIAGTPVELVRVR